MKKLWNKKIFFIFIYKMMITNFKIFETVSTQPNLGDYVILFPKNGSSEALSVYNKFISENVGEIVEIRREHGGTGYIYFVKFENIPEILSFSHTNYFRKNNTSDYTTQHFRYWSENKEELEAILSAEKYNL
jgi:hypothetical protein